MFYFEDIEFFYYYNLKCIKFIVQEERVSLEITCVVLAKVGEILGRVKYSLREVVYLKCYLEFILVIIIVDIKINREDFIVLEKFIFINYVFII